MHILDPRCIYVKHYFRHYLQYLRSIKPLAHSICAVFVQYPAVFLGGISAVFHSIRIVFHSILQYLHSICSCLTVQYYSIAYPQRAVVTAITATTVTVSPSRWLPANRLLSAACLRPRCLSVDPGVRRRPAARALPANDAYTI